MRHPNVPTELAEAVEAIARDSGLTVAYDTHYDAGNVALSWWTGKKLNRLDFQPLHDAEIQVTFLTDAYPVLPRLLRWARRSIPLFPHIAKTEYRVLGNLSRDERRNKYATQIRDFLARAA
jgi:hypothetical protein